VLTACSESGIGWRGAQDGLSLACQGDGFAGLAEVAGKVAHASQDMSGELLVAADPDEGERPAEMPPGGHIAVGVVRHPPISVRAAAAVNSARLSAPASAPKSRGAISVCRYLITLAYRWPPRDHRHQRWQGVRQGPAV
jgi:hypothetical protein